MPSGISISSLRPSGLVTTVGRIQLPKVSVSFDGVREKIEAAREAISEFSGGDLLREGKELVSDVKEKLSDPVFRDGASRTTRGVAHTHTAVKDLTSTQNRVFRPEQPSRPPQGRQPGEVRVTSWNLHHGTSPDSQGAQDTLTQQIQQISKSDSDVVLLQEVLPWQVEEIVEKTGMTGYYTQTTGRQGNMILLSPSLEVVKDQRKTLNYDFDRSDSLDALKASLRSKGGEPRAAQSVTFKRPDGKGEVTVFNTHLSTGDASPQQRAEEARTFHQFVDAQRSDTVIGGGDLNMRSSHPMLDDFKRSGYAIEGDRIDHLLTLGVTSSELSVSDPHQGTIRLSDHPMVVGNYRID